MIACQNLLIGFKPKRQEPQKDSTNGRELQASWDRSVMIRVPLLVVSLLAQCFVLLVASA